MARSDLAHIKRIRANIRGLEKAGRDHRKNCPRCAQAVKLQRNDLFCDTGWEWAKDHHREVRRLDRALADDGGQLPGQIALW